MEVHDCVKLDLKECMGLGYQYTFPESSEYNNTEIWGELIGNHPTCSPKLRKYFCSLFAAPCFDNEPFSAYGMCRDECEQVHQECSDVPSSDWSHLLGDKASWSCRMFDSNIKRNGFCLGKTWPHAVLWDTLNRSSAMTAPVTPPNVTTPILSTTPSAVPGVILGNTNDIRPFLGSVLVATIVVPTLVVIIFIVAVVVLWKRYRTTVQSRFHYQNGIKQELFSDQDL